MAIRQKWLEREQFTTEGEPWGSHWLNPNTDSYSPKQFGPRPFTMPRENLNQAAGTTAWKITPQTQ